MNYFQNASASARSAFALALIVACCGCSRRDGPERFHVSGKVTYLGKPIPYGSVIFQPDTAKGNTGPQGAANIVNGEYDTSKGGSGCVGGPHKVMITGLDRIADEFSTPGLLFAEYVEEVEMPHENSNRDFVVEFKKALGRK